MYTIICDVDLKPSMSHFMVYDTLSANAIGSLLVILLQKNNFFHKKQKKNMVSCLYTI